jgi:hypothetical protein
MKFENKRVRMKKNEKKNVLQFEKTYFLSRSFLAGPFDLQAQDDL